MSPAQTRPPGRGAQADLEHRPPSGRFGRRGADNQQHTRAEQDSPGHEGHGSGVAERLRFVVQLEPRRVAVSTIAIRLRLVIRRCSAGCQSRGNTKGGQAEATDENGFLDYEAVHTAYTFNDGFSEVQCYWALDTYYTWLREEFGFAPAFVDAETSLPGQSMWIYVNMNFENGFFIAFAHPKQSLVTGPGGEVELDSRDRKDSLVLHEIDLDRTNLSHIEDRRTDLYVACR